MEVETALDHIAMGQCSQHIPIGVTEEDENEEYQKDLLSQSAGFTVIPP